ncbi:hypothetical protein HUT18_20375 [Streptomyces sp. NA04227]|uniref:hypothetical protein n=1 Tax=Streptomyces sp. NA04227 TaxID=2742136 RepID=UPI001590B6D8|nr:hypothetical protein [Streptomyces sp. NA04227]QKW08376.1 hypothetical protein HUT18_20375 [Streptomyces sp. NA04227]
MRFLGKTCTTALACAVVISIGGTGVASAAVTDPKISTSSSDGGVAEAEQVLAKYLEALHTGSLTDGDGNIDNAAIEDQFGPEIAAAVAEKLAEQSGVSQALPKMSAGAASGEKSAQKGKLPDYAKCVLAEIGLGALTGASGTMSAKFADLIADKKWTTLAKLLTKEGLKAGIKVGAKGGLAGFVSTITVAAVSCKFKGIKDIFSW